MIQNVLTGIDGVGLYGVISICIFVAVFLGVVLWVLRLKKPYLKTMRELPLTDDVPASRADPNTRPEVNHE